MTNPSYINDLPNPSDFGESFNYAAWTPNTQIELCNVPWNSDYRDIVEFSSQADLDAYLNGVTGAKILISRLTLARAGDPVRINLPFNACYKFNYLRVNNGTSPITAKYVDPNGVVQTVTDTPKTLYYFIQDVIYMAPNTTQLSVMLDVWQTFGRQIDFGNCYIERGHIGIANSHQFNNQGRDYLTVPEGLDIGNEYNINETYKFQIPDNQDSGDDNSSAWVVMGIAADVTSDPGDTTNPSLNTTVNLSSTDGLPNGFNLLYFKSIDDFQWFIANFRETPWITQTIMFITLIPPLSTVSIPDNLGGSITISDMSSFGVWDTEANELVDNKAFVCTSGETVRFSRKLANNFRDRALSFIPDRYKILKKLLTSPYMFVEMTTYNGTPLMLRPELIPDDDIYVDIFQHSAPPSPRWAIVPSHYNATGTDGDVDDGEFIDFATYINNFPQFTVLNNNYLEYLASNKNSIAYAYSSADWSEQKALQGAQTSFDNAQSNITNQQTQADIQRNANSRSNFNENVNSGANSLIGAVTSANPVSATADIVHGGLGIMVSNANMNIRNNAISQSNQSQNIYTAALAQRNYDFANYAAKGDYQNSINAVQARVQDAQMIQPSSVGQLGGESLVATLFGPSLGSAYTFDYRNGTGWRIYVKLKMLNPGYMALVGEYWLRYGYAVNRFGRLPSSFKCMTKFSYWKLKETYITSSACPEVYKQTIRGIFEKGVTVWVDPDDIGNIDLADNQPLSGIHL